MPSPDPSKRQTSKKANSAKSQRPKVRSIKKLVFHRSNDYRIYSASSFWGGLDPEGKGIIVNVCKDHNTFASDYPIAINELNNSNIGEVISLASEDHYVERLIQCGISFDIDSAKSLVVWLIKHINEAEKHNAKNK